MLQLPVPYVGCWVVVPATIVDVAPHLWPWTFAMHRALTSSGWVVSNIETGGAVAGHPLRPNAVREARAVLARIDVDAMHASALKMSARTLSFGAATEETVAQTKGTTR